MGDSNHGATYMREGGDECHSRGTPTMALHAQGSEFKYDGACTVCWMGDPRAA